MLNVDGWREVFWKQMREAKPGDAWSLRGKQHLGVQNVTSGWKETVQEHAQASFLCSQCDHTWSSHQVVILFHLYWEPSRRQGWVRMRPFRQECHKCASAQKEEPQFTREDMESVVRRLILDIREKCYRERVHRGELSEVVCEGRGPHKSESCEACQMGLHKGRHGKPDGALHHGRSDGALHNGKLYGAVPHGKPGSALHQGSSRSPRYYGTVTLHSYEVPRVHISRRRTLIQPPRQYAVTSASRPCCVCCVLLSAACVIFVLVAYWMDLFKG